jgi:hypothetical protein
MLTATRPCQLGEQEEAPGAVSASRAPSDSIRDLERRVFRPYPPLPGWGLTGR